MAAGGGETNKRYRLFFPRLLRHIELRTKSNVGILPTMINSVLCIVLSSINGSWSALFHRLRCNFAEVMFAMLIAWS